MRCRAGYATVGMALLLSGCAGAHLGLANADISSDLGLRSDPSAFNLVAGGAGFLSPLRVSGSTRCSVAFDDVFIPPGRSGEAAGGEGVTFSYAEVLSIGWHCPSTVAAHTVFGEQLSAESAMGGRAVPNVADQASLLNVGNQANQGYPDDRVYIAWWREGEYLGALQLVGPLGDRHVTPGVAESLARLEASRTSTIR